jgi:hypothetical protein
MIAMAVDLAVDLALDDLEVLMEVSIIRFPRCCGFSLVLWSSQSGQAS